MFPSLRVLFGQSPAGEGSCIIGKSFVTGIASLPRSIAANRADAPIPLLHEIATYLDASARKSTDESGVSDLSAHFRGGAHSKTSTRWRHRPPLGVVSTVPPGSLQAESARDGVSPSLAGHPLHVGHLRTDPGSGPSGSRLHLSRRKVWQDREAPWHALIQLRFERRLLGRRERAGRASRDRMGASPFPASLG